MKKLFIVILFILLIPINTLGLEYPSINSKNTIIYDLKDKKILYENNSKEKSSIASLTKIATTILAIENIKDLNKKVTITNKILSTVSLEASKAGLKNGDVLTYNDLLYASMLPSGADATNAIAISSSGSIDNYVSKMNDLASKLGMKSTHFNNVTGLDDKNHYSSANDVRILLEYALKNDTFRKVFTTKKYTMSNGKVVKSTLYKYGNDDIILGSKTGFTNDAGYCLSSLSNINGHEMIIIVLKADKINNTYYNIIDSIKLINFMKKNYKDQILINKNKEIKNLKVNLSKIDNYKVYSKHVVKKYLPSDYDKKKFKIKYSGLDELNFMNNKNDKIGNIKYYYDNKLLLEEDVVLNTDIDMSIKKVIFKYYYVLIGIFLIIVLMIIRIKNKKKRKKTKRK